MLVVFVIFLLVEYLSNVLKRMARVFEMAALYVVTFTLASIEHTSGLYFDFKSDFGIFENGYSIEISLRHDDICIRTYGTQEQSVQ